MHLLPLAIGVGAVSVAGGVAVLLRARSATGRLVGLGLIVMAVGYGLLSWTGTAAYGITGGRRPPAVVEPAAALETLVPAALR